MLGWVLGRWLERCFERWFPKPKNSYGGNIDMAHRRVLPFEAIRAAVAADLTLTFPQHPRVGFNVCVQHID